MDTHENYDSCAASSLNILCMSVTVGKPFDEELIVICFSVEIKKLRNLIDFILFYSAG